MENKCKKDRCIMSLPPFLQAISTMSMCHVCVWIFLIFLIVITLHCQGKSCGRWLQAARTTRCSITTTMSETFFRSMRIGGKVIGFPPINWPSVKSMRSTDQPHSLFFGSKLHRPRPCGSRRFKPLRHPTGRQRSAQRPTACR